MGLLSTIGAASARAYGFTRSAVSAAVDAYFNRVTLLLNTSSTNGAQNNTFLDSSSNNFSITRNPTSGPNAPTQGTFTPFSQTGWSNYFNGTTDSLNAPAGSPFAFGTGAWTVEAWVYVTTLQNILLFDTRSSASNDGVGCLITSTGTLSYSGSANNALTSSAITANSWNHVAWSYDGTTLSGYINGSRGGTATPTFNITQNNGFIGRVGFAASAYMNGYISNLRVVKGAAVYSGASFTVPTLPLGATSGGQNPPTGTQTSLLTCQSNRFIDNGGLATPNTITVNGTPRVQAFSPFAPTAAYDTTTVGGSGYFDGTGDYLSVARNNAFLPGANTDFTFEAWVYPTATPGAQGAIIVGLGEYGTDSDWDLDINSSLQFALYLNSTTATSFRNTTTTVKLNAWNHVAASRSGTGTNNLKVFVNGVGQSFTTNQTSVGTGTRNLSIGADQDGTEAAFTGYISGLRLINGQGIYTSDFTPPTAPPTTTSGGVTASNTALLLNFTNAGIYDSSAKNVLETVADAQVSTTQAKWGTTSMKFDGTGDYLLSPASNFYDFGTGDFTIEGWIYPSSVSATAILVDVWTNGLGSYTTGQFQISINSSAKFVFTVATGLSSTVNLTSTTAISANTWTYFALVRSGTGTGNVKVYLNGTADATTLTHTGQVGLSNRTLAIGVELRSTSAYYNGYIDDLRITKGYARTISSSPTAAFPLQ